jgi:hypothetical protein
VFLRILYLGRPQLRRELLAVNGDGDVERARVGRAIVPGSELRRRPFPLLAQFVQPRLVHSLPPHSLPPLAGAGEEFSARSNLIHDVFFSFESNHIFH